LRKDCRTSFCATLTGSGLYIATKFQENPYWRDYVLFYEYFRGDSGAGLGARHQTGSTGIIARLNPEDARRVSKDEPAARMKREHVAGALTSRSTAEWFGIVGLDF